MDFEAQEEQQDDVNKRRVKRLDRHPEHSWTLAVEGDMLITKNISNISPFRDCRL